MIARQRDENPAGIHLPLDPLPGHSSRGRLERVLRRGEFAVTTELNPPDSADPEDVYNPAKIFDGWVDAINAVDASGANCHMSSVGICALLTRMGYAPIMQIACRDKNRIAIQGDVLGGAAMGVANMLCLTGDGVQAGDQPGAKPVFDLDSMSLLETCRIMRDNGKFLSGRKLTTPPQIFLGAAVNPFAPPFDFRPIHLGKKIAAGAQFVQTQYCFDVPMFKTFMQKARDLGHTAPDAALAATGVPMAADHRRILATAIGRLRGKIKYRPVVFELMPPAFTLLQLQLTVEALSGVRLHKQNFRRLVEQQGLVEETGAMTAETGGRPARLVRFRHDVLAERAITGTKLPLSRT